MSNKRVLGLLAVASMVCAAFGQSPTQFTGPAPLAWRWQQTTTESPASVPTLSEDKQTVYVAVGERIYALNRVDGNQKWRYPSGEPLSANFKGTPLLVNGTVLCAAGNKTLYAMDAATGNFKWSYIADKAIAGDLVSNGKVVAFSQGDREIMAVNLSDGSPFYATSDGLPNPFEIEGGVTGQLGMWNDSLLVFSDGRKLTSYNVATHKESWHVDFDSLDSRIRPVVTKTNIFVNSGEFLISISAANGSAKFQKSVGTDLAFDPAISEDQVGVVTSDGHFAAYDLSGKAITKDPIDLGSEPFASPTALGGGYYAVPTANGMINLVNTKTGVLWNYPVRPVGGVQTLNSTNTMNGNKGKGGNRGSGPGGPGGPGGEGPGGGGGLGGGGLGGGGLTGGGQGLGGVGGGQGTPGGAGSSRKQNQKIITIQAAGPAVLADGTLLLLARDGSLLAFDKTLGVDLTAPTVQMIFPNAGDQVNPGYPLELVFKVEDEASGVNTGTLKITIDGKVVKHTLDSEGFAVVQFSSAGPNRIMLDGRRKIVVEVSDWLGNVRHEEFVITADTNLAPVVLPGQSNRNGKGGPNGPGGPGGPGGGGGKGGGGGG